MDEQPLPPLIGGHRDDPHRPSLGSRAQSDNVDANGLGEALRVGQTLGGGGVTDGDSHILTDDMTAEQLERGAVGQSHLAHLNDEDGVGQAVDHLGKAG